MSRGQKWLTAVLGAGLLVAAPAWAQQATNLDPADASTVPGIPDQLRPDLVAPGAPATYTMGAGDLVSIFVQQMPDLTRQVRVGDTGDVRLPLLGQPIAVAGLTAEQASIRIGQALVAAGLAVTPRVDVTVRQVMSRPITVMGEVTRPTIVQAFKPMTLLEVLSRAGGTTIHAGDQILVSQPSGAGVQTKSYSLTALLHSGSAATNPVLTGGEEVRVLPMKSVYVVGAFQHPGAFGIQPGDAISVLRAVALGQGIKQPANAKSAEIIRTNAAGEHTEIPINIDAMLHHRAADVALQGGDIVYVPESGKRAFLNTILADAGSAAVIAAGYSLRF